MLRFALILVVCFAAIPGVAQQPLTVPNKVSVADTGNGTFYYGSRNDPPRAIAFRQPTVTTSKFLANINEYLNVPGEFTFVETASNADQLGMKHRLLQQYYKGLPLDGLSYRVHEKQGYVTSANGRAIRDIKLETQTRISEKQAYHLAAQSVKGIDSVSGKGQLLITSRNFAYTPGSFAVAYQFDINVSFIERWRISIDARTGEVINKASLAYSCAPEEGIALTKSTPKNAVRKAGKVNSSSGFARPTVKEVRPTPWLPYATGTGLSSYYGRRTIQVEKFGEGDYSQLTGKTAHGGLISTYDFQNVPVISLTWFWEWHKAYLFNSSTNTYDHPYLRPAVSAQWAAEQAFEYYYKKHNRNSFDNKGTAIKSYVHVDDKMNNAFWVHDLIAFGDGSRNNPLVELDVVSHELTHGVTQYEAKLTYSGESGALNESFSDIMGKAVEFDLFGDSATWQMAKHYDVGGIRDLSNPNLKNQPDTYAGDLWYTGYDDSGGVHTNSGVQNFWFYLLSEGGSGVNDKYVSYTINAIGIEAATKIAYRNLTEYLSQQSEYLDSRIGSMLAAADLYGYNSVIYKEVEKAWDAVGVIDEPIVTSLEAYDITATTVRLKGTLLPRGNNVTYRFDYGTTPALGTSSAVYPYTNTVTGQLTGLESKTKYYLNLVATNENGSSTFPLEFTTISLAPMVRIRETVDVTETTAILYGKVNPNSLSTDYYFEYGTTTALGSVTPTFTLPNATDYLDVSVPVANLQPRQTYYYRLKATNSYATAVTETVQFYTGTKPVIISFSPLTAPVGAEITITGSNFNAQPENNLVSFGATRATVTSASPSQLKVRVPPGASFSTISLLDAQSGLTAESVREFVPTFTGFKKGDLHLTMGITEPYIYETFVHDIDGDNKPDIVARHYLGFSVYQNVNQGGDLTEQSFVRSTFNSGTEYSPSSLALIDFDGNGMKDVVVRYQGTLRVYPNMSVPGYVFFGAPIDVPNTDSLGEITFADFDQDGRIDICGEGNVAGTNGVVIIRNQNPTGSLSSDNFLQRYAIPIAHSIWWLKVNDMNNDGKPDLVMGIYGSDFLQTLRNNSQPGAFAFEVNATNDVLKGKFAQFLNSDLNGDGWRDIVQYSQNNIGNAVIYENIKSAPQFGFRQPVLVLSDYIESAVLPGDFNGDGKVDLVVGTNKRELIFLGNNGNSGSPISNNNFEKVSTRGMKLDQYGEVQTRVTMNDLNGDGRPEVIANYGYSYAPHDGYVMEIWQNAPGNCLDPSLVKVDVSGYTATIGLPAATRMEDYEMAYMREAYGYESWMQITEPDFNVWSGSKYRLRVRAKCYLEYTEYAYVDFSTDCIDLSSFKVTPGIDKATLYAYSLSYMEIEYSRQGDNAWIAVPQYDTQISNLAAGTTYDIRFRGRCYEPIDFHYDQFTTLCPKLNALNVVDIDYDQAKVNWNSTYDGEASLEYSIDNVTWASIDATQTMTGLAPATKYYVRGQMGCTNLDSDFLYTSFITKCAKVFNLTVDASSPFGANVSWTDDYHSERYILSYRVNAGGPSTLVKLSTTSYELTDLKPGGAYVVTVWPECTSDANVQSEIFSTLCYTPSSLSVSDVTYTTARMAWSSPYSGVPYVVDYSISGSGVWKSVKTSETYLELSNLRPGTRYDIRVHIECLSMTAAYASVSLETGLYDETTYGPNPTLDKITLRPSKNLIGNHFVLSDNAGRIMLSGELLDYTIDFTNYARGVYVLRIDGEEPIRIVRL
jgi:Zn-dependent metalloprotease